MPLVSSMDLRRIAEVTLAGDQRVVAVEENGGAIHFGAAEHHFHACLVCHSGDLQALRVKVLHCLAALGRDEVGERDRREEDAGAHGGEHQRVRVVLGALGLEPVRTGDEVEAAVDERRDPDVRGVERDGYRLVVATEQPGRERHDADEPQQHHVHEHEPPVRPDQPGEQTVVAEPEDGQHEKADDPGQDLGQQVHKGMRKVAGAVLGQLQFDHQQRHGDGVDAVGERLAAVNRQT